MRHYLGSENLSRGSDQAGEPGAHVRRRLSSCRDKPAELNTASARAVGGTAWADRPGPPVPAPRGAVHSQVRRGIAEGLSPDELRHVAFRAMTTLGLPKEVTALTWIEDIVEEGGKP